MKQDIELYAHVVRTADWFELSIGRDVPGNPSQGAANWIGVFSTPDEAVRYAQERGVDSQRISVEVPLFRIASTVDGGTVLKRVS